MADNEKSGIGLLILVFGIILLIIGVILSFYEIMLAFNIQTGGMRYTPHLFTYPYQFVGIVLVLAGIVIAIVGGYRWKTRQKKEIKQ